MKVFEYIIVSLTCIGIKKMKKLVLVLPLLLAACGDDAEKRIKDLEAQQNQARMQMEQQQQQMAMQQQQLYNQQQQQPQYAPQAPVVVPQQPQHDNTIMNMAVGALAGHAISNAMNSSNNDRPSERVVEHKTVIVDNRQPVNPVQNNVASVQPSAPSVLPKQNYMDMNKLSQSAKYAPPSSNNVVSSVKPSVPRPSSMNMSKLSRR